MAGFSAISNNYKVCDHIDLMVHILIYQILDDHANLQCTVSIGSSDRTKRGF